MKIEAGKFYKTRDGLKVGPMEAFGPKDRYREEMGDGRYWFQDGNAGHQAENDDLISEWRDLTPHKQLTAEMIKVMQAYVDGEEVELMFDGGKVWHKDDEPLWDWRGGRKYRIAPAATPDTINWDHVAPEFKWMARDSAGQCWLYHTEPKSECCSWYSMDGVTPADSFTSYRRGTCDWKDSLVKRP